MKKLSTFLASLFIAVAALNAQTCDFTINPSGAAGQYTFTGPSNDFSPNEYFFFWILENNSEYTSGPSVNHTYTESMLDSVILEIYNADSMLVCTSTQALFVDVPGSDCSITYSIAPDNANVYVFESSGNFLNTVFWTITGDNIEYIGGNLEYTFSQAGVYNVCANITTNQVLECSTCITVTVLQDSSDCNYSISYSISPANPNQYFFEIAGVNTDILWDFGDSASVAATGEVSHEFQNDGDYLVCANIFNASGNDCFICFPIFVNNDTNIVTPDCNAEFWASTSALVGYFIPTGYYTNTPTSYAWDFGDGATSTEMYPYHNYNEAGNYEVCLTVANGNCTDTYCEMVSIPEQDIFWPDSLCYAEFVISQDNPFEVTVVNGSSGQDLDFSWTLTGEGISITSSGAFPSIEVASTGAFEFCLTVSGPFCSAIYCDSIIIGDNGIIGGKVSAAGFTINVKSPQEATGFVLNTVDPINDKVYTIFPNPFESVLQLSSNSNDSNSLVEIYSLNGRLIQQSIMNGNTLQVNTSNLKAGVYLLQISDSNQNRSIHKIVKK
ncbi:MAG: PKD domain-containing protein [Bacteroidia bacterium]